MIDELLLHVGPPRTGTTTIQAALAYAAAESALLGTFIPIAEGDEPGQHLPILRDVVGEAAMMARYSFSHDTLSLEAVLRAAADAACKRLLLSAEEFSTAPADAMALIRAIGPKQVTVLQTVRSVVPWMLSLFAQYITYGLNEMSTWQVGRFAEFFAEVVLPAPLSAVEQWKDGPWEVRTRTLFLGRGSDIRLLGSFSRLSDLPVPLLPLAPANQRLDPCRLHILQALNLAIFDANKPLAELAVTRELVLSSLLSTEFPPHDCQCADVLPLRIREYLSDATSRLLPQWLAGSERFIGEPVVTSLDDTELAYPAFPQPSAWKLVSLMIPEVVTAGIR